MWTQIVLPDGWGQAWIDYRPLVSDEVLRRIPDIDTRESLRRAIGKAMADQDVVLADVRALRQKCSDSIREITIKGQVLMWRPAEFDKALAPWKEIETLCRVVLDERGRAIRAEIDADYVTILLLRWLRLRAQSFGVMEGVHSLDGHEVVDGIIQPKTGGNQWQT